jgi:phosphatidylglycerol:prolipoprotein diacylglycerol transferase
MDESTRDETMGWYLLLYSAGRFVIEFLRGDSARGFIGALSTSQFIGLFLIAAGIIVLIQVKKNGKAKKEAVL